MDFQRLFVLVFRVDCLMRLNPAALHHQHVRAIFVQLRQNVAGHQNRHAFRFQAQQQLRQFIPRFGVEPAGRFVQQQELRAVDNHLSDADTLFLAARKRFDAVV